MKRETFEARKNWEERVEGYGFDIHHIDGEIYWAEDAAYRFTPAEIDTIEDVTNELHQLSLKAVDKIVTSYRAGDTSLIGKFDIPPQLWPQVAASWEKREPSLYGRFDLQYDGVNPPKMLEYNADTPTSLYESSILQWDWLKEAKPEGDQFNMLHDNLVARWNTLASPRGEEPVHFMGALESREDFICTEYLRDTCAQAGHSTHLMDVDELAWDEKNRGFVDDERNPVKTAFKLYPWEHIAMDEAASLLEQQAKPVNWVEPMWKMLLSNKAILPVLWEMNPGHPNLLKASFNQEAFAGEDHVVKPKLSREGANVTVVLNNMTAQKTGGDYNENSVIYQAYAPMPEFDGYRPVLGSWVVGDTASGLGIREEKGFVTTNQSRFVPHFIAA